MTTALTEDNLVQDKLFKPILASLRDLDIVTGDKERKIALSISKLKAARYLDFGLEELVPSLWVESEQEYDISSFAEVMAYHSLGGLGEGRILHQQNIDTYPILLSFTHCGNKLILRVLRIIPVILPEHPSEKIAVHNEMAIPARAKHQQALAGDGDGNSSVKRFANFFCCHAFFTSAQDGDPSQDDVRLCLDDDLKKAQDHIQRQATSWEISIAEATLQVVYDVLKLTPFYKAFQVTADRDSSKFALRSGYKKFKEHSEKEILAFLASLGHFGEIRNITDVNVNKLHQPWRSFTAIINKCLSGKPSYDSLRLSQAQILWGMYNNKKVDYAYLLWEDFIYQIENKNTKKGNAIDDPCLTINVISRNEDTQLYGAILPAELTNEDIRNSESYKELLMLLLQERFLQRQKQVRRKLMILDEPLSRASSVPKVKEEENVWKNDVISWRSSEDDQADDKNDDDENAQDDENDDKNDDDENAQDDENDDKNDDDEMSEETDEDDTFDPIVHTPSHVSSSDDEDNENEVEEGVGLLKEKSREDASIC
ncbi:hypothetical protein Tco_0425000 [Tanacetum coccineum]